jgi:hypothetical protein
MSTLVDPDTAHTGLPRPILTTSRVKVSPTFNAFELLTVPAPEGRPRVALRIGLPRRFVTAEIAAKSRKAQTAIREAGADNIALVLQGHLTAAQPKTPPPGGSMTHPGVTMGRFSNEESQASA